MNDAFLKLRKINKSFDKTSILNDINLDVGSGEVCVLLGENGSGKSTLAKILSGAIIPDSGDIIINGKIQKIKSTNDAKKLGIGMVYQDVVDIGGLSVCENVFLGMENIKKITGMLNYKKMASVVESLIEKFNLKLDVSEKASNLSYAQKQYIQLLRVIILDPSIVIFDEITAALTDVECEIIFEIVKQFKRQGKSIIYITHKPADVKAIGDSIYILKDGEVVGIKLSSEAMEDELIHLMLGKDIKDHFPKLLVKKGEEIMRAEGFSSKFSHDISFALHEGEILGITGLVGSGKTSVIESVLGLSKVYQGRVYIQGKLVRIKRPLDFIRHGIGYIPENGDIRGLFLDLSIGHNISISSLKDLRKRFQISRKKETSLVRKLCTKLGIQMMKDNLKTLYLSNGNRQKVNLARWIMTKCNIFVMDEPTVGVDVNGKVEIYNLMNELIRRGAGIILVSSNLSEVAGMCDRIIIIKNGHLHAILMRDEATQEKIFRMF